MMAAMAAGPHKELVSFRDEASPERIWTFDVTFLASTYRCTFGCGCGDATGVGECCTLGVGLWTDEDEREQCAADEAAVRARITQLTDEDWQLRRVAARRGGPIKLVDGRPMTRVVDGGCIFNNRAGFPGGTGCAFHRAALRRGERPVDWKPRTCWMVPLMREELADGSILIRGVTNTDWSADGDDEPLDWWCVDDAANYAGGGEPVYRTMRDELIAVCGAAVYAELAAYLDARRPVTAGSLPVAWVGTRAERPADGTTGRPVGPSLPMAR
jgi:hypothetical protein